MIRDYTVFTGCSFTEGIGLPDTTNNKNLWVNVLYNSFECLTPTQLLNLGKGASTNLEIFERSISALSKYHCKYLFVAWTTLYRYKFSLGVENYDVSQYWTPTQPLLDVNVNPGVVYQKQYLTDIKNKFFSLHHDHHEIVKILNYTTIIDRMCQKLGVECYFVYNILPWDRDYFKPVNDINRVPSDTTLYTQN